MSSDNLIPELDRDGLRTFGVTTGGIVALIFGLLVPWLLGSAFPVWPWVIAGGLVGWGIAAPATMRSVYRGWMRFGLLMSRITTPLVLGMVFYLILTPLGLVRRAVSTDGILKRRDPSATTYRISRNKTEPIDLKRPF